MLFWAFSSNTDPVYSSVFLLNSNISILLGECFKSTMTRHKKKTWQIETTICVGKHLQLYPALSVIFVFLFDKIWLYMFFISWISQVVCFKSHLPLSEQYSNVKTKDWIITQLYPKTDFPTVWVFVHNQSAGFWRAARQVMATFKTRDVWFLTFYVYITSLTEHHLCFSLNWSF